MLGLFVCFLGRVVKLSETDKHACTVCSTADPSPVQQTACAAHAGGSHTTNLQRGRGFLTPVDPSDKENSAPKKGRVVHMAAACTT